MRYIQCLRTVLWIRMRLLRSFCFKIHFMRLEGSTTRNQRYIS